MNEEGVSKFQLQFQRAAPPPFALVMELIDWRTRLLAQGVVGADATRYGGIGFGNLSRRHPGRPDAFIITGTQTGAHVLLGCHDFAIVTHCDACQNRIVAHGGRAPSSEAMTHGVLYACNRGISWVFHGHAPALWRAAARLALASTPADIAYGTPGMAEAVQHFATDAPLPGMIVMAGHEDGVLAFGAQADSTGELLQRQLQRATSTPTQAQRR